MYPYQDDFNENACILIKAGSVRQCDQRATYQMRVVLPPPIRITREKAIEMVRKSQKFNASPNGQDEQKPVPYWWTLKYAANIS